MLECMVLGRTIPVSRLKHLKLFRRHSDYIPKVSDSLASKYPAAQYNVTSLFFLPTLLPNPHFTKVSPKSHCPILITPRLLTARGHGQYMMTYSSYQVKKKVADS